VLGLLLGVLVLGLLRLGFGEEVGVGADVGVGWGELG